MVQITRAASVAVLACALVLPAAAPAAAEPVPDAAVAVAASRPRLPTPTGPYAVGSSVLHLVDRSRPDPWVPEAGGRELMVTVHYPAARAGGGRHAGYATTEETRLLVQGMGIESAVPARELAGTRTNSRVDVRPASGRHPLVLLSPGFGVSRYTLTHLAEDLASRGYVVASVDHAYESYGIAVPGGRMLTCVACEAVDEHGADPGRVTAARAADMTFVLDRLTGRDPAWRYSRVIDGTRVGMAGHSIGGAAAATAMAADPRIDAGINMDGAFWDRLPAKGLRGRPFMMLGTDDAVHRPGGTDTTWDSTWPTLDGWKRWVTVSGSEHFTFSDSPVVLSHFGLPQPPLPADRAITLTRTFVAAFFDEHLRATPQPVLTGPTPAHPEARFHTP
ncbi:alpha/beta hydrolase family protein [Streptomyces vilmorinianum]|uniref:alpha/beta hydrolase family protein n=1 Tax=Streptomyces vilmorinianum TaxID=3051092 RepID=UPI0010FB20B1|nr:alpha/beta hydrolase [Streptomyces vilmorinianum]